VVGELNPRSILVDTECFFPFNGKKHSVSLGRGSQLARQTSDEDHRERSPKS